MENPKNLPIKLFHKRVSDERKTEGGGANSDPSWLLTDEELLVRSTEFSNTIDETIVQIKERNPDFDFIPSVLNLQLDDDAIAKTHRSEIKKVFNVNKKSNIIGYSQSHNLMVKVDSVEDAVEIKLNIQRYYKNRIAISAIEELSIFHPHISVDEDVLEAQDSSFKISLINYYDSALNKAIAATFEHYCKSESIDVRRITYSPDLILYKSSTISQGKLNKIKSFSALEGFSFMPKYRITIDSTETDEVVDVREPDNSVEYPTVGILDSGISDIDHLRPWLASEKYSAYPDEYVDKSHGTFVAGIILYGDNLENKELSGLQGCKIFDAIVFPKTDIDEDELIDNIREAIRRHKDIKIWNLSLGTTVTAEVDSFSDFGIALDSIQEVYNVLICKSAGNCRNFLSNRPISRIAKSADSIRSLVVGSIAHKKSKNDISEVNNLSPFSRIGFAPAGIIKPELVSYGGNAGVNKLGNSVQSGVTSFGINGDILTAVGTSFSTPRITSLVAALSHNIDDEFSPSLLKALAIHSSKYPEGVSISASEKLRNLGFGLPSPVSEIIFNDPHEITLIQQDTLVKGEFFEILEFPYPENLVNDEGFFYGEIKITLVASPVLNESQGVEYCQSNIDVFFGTYDKLIERDISKPNILNEIGLDGNENLIKGSNYSKHFHKDITSSYANERMLLSYGKKYQPIKKWVVDLDEMTPANREKYLKTPKKWYLKVKGLYRDFSESLALEDGEELSQDFCLVVTIRDKNNEKRVYDNVSQLLNQRNFTHSDIRLREQLRTKV